MLSSIIYSSRISKKCDGDRFLFLSNKCDQYVRVLVDDQEIFRTSMKEDTNYAVYNERFQMGIILKTAKITMQIWDDDTGYSEDDLMSSCVTNIDQLLKIDTLYCDGSTIKMSLEWQSFTTSCN